MGYAVQVATETEKTAYGIPGTTQKKYSYDRMKKTTSTSKIEIEIEKIKNQKGYEREKKFRSSEKARKKERENTQENAQIFENADSHAT